MDPLRVLFLTHSYPRVAGDAAGSFLWHLAVALRDEDVEVRVLAPSAPGHPAHDAIEGIVVDRFRYAPAAWETLAYTGNMASEVRDTWHGKIAMAGFLAAGAGALRRARAAFAPHLVHAHWWFPAGLIATWGDQGPVVTTMHGSDVRLAAHTPAAHRLVRRVLRRSRAATTVSTWLRDEVKRMAPGSNPRVAPMPVATSLFRPGRGGVRLLYVGRLNAQKGIAQLVEALALTREPLALDVVGDGPDDSALRERAKALGIAERITWHGAQPQPALPRFYQEALATVVPSVGEGLGLVAVEAQLCECPVVAFASGGTLDVVAPESTGLLVPPGDVVALAAALDRIASAPDAARTMGREGRVRALGRFAPDAVARGYAALYREVLDRSAGRGTNQA